jgi:type IV pilus assembly protein PilE
MSLKNKKGFTLVEVLVVVIIIVLMALMAYPSYTNSLEQARAKEAVDLLLHIATAQQKVFADCYYTEDDGQCSVVTDFEKLPFDISTSGVDVSPSSVTTPSFVYTISSNTLTARARREGFDHLIYTDLNPAADDKSVYCKFGSSDKSNKICAALGKKIGASNVFKIL